MKILFYPFLITLIPIFIALFLKFLKDKFFPKFPVLIISIIIGLIGIITTFSAMIMSINAIHSKCANGAVIFLPLGLGATAFGILLNVKNNLFNKKTIPNTFYNDKTN
ncbi:hypothetical protein [Flavobacterium sp. 5]|uniref:hypothetical protein n=1 Tax=Flavobacterium sp. 5 TaxID=2035199 RepID=UPI000CA7DA66|nr:hypothetical protein [Flavobacterium sp. 5]PKB15205.1 hypothetical protein CLU82_0269 [Flavobacterium sp. 5]